MTAAELRADHANAEAGGATRIRDPALDFVKGVLVVGMVVYHAMNVFTWAGAAEYAYVRFVSGSFVLISGFIVAQAYGEAIRERSAEARRRLWIRGLKLIVLFAILNLLIVLTGVGNPAKTSNVSQGALVAFYDAFILGKVGAASFQILLPLGYVLVLATLLLRLGPVGGWLLVPLVALLFSPSLQSSSAVNLEFGVLGSIGLAAGLLHAQAPRLPGLSSMWAVSVSITAAMLLMGQFGYDLPALTLLTAVLLRLFYDLGVLAGPDRLGSRAMQLLGRYSLFGYIAQIVILQLGSRLLLRPKWDVGPELALVIGSTTVALLVLCWGLDQLIRRSRLASSAYRLVFA